MRIHSSSLAPIPLNYRKPSTEAVDVVGDVAKPDAVSGDKQTPKNQSNLTPPQTPAAIQEILASEKNHKANEFSVSDSTAKPFNTRIQFALNAYNSHPDVVAQNQRTHTVVGVDFYV